MRHARFVLSALAPAALFLAACGGSGGGAQSEASDDRTIGAEDAPVQVIEYASITCSHCKRWHEEVWPEVEQMVEAGQVRFIFREFPTPPQEIAVAGFLVARCAPEERYFSVLETLFARQDRLFTNAREELLAVARGAGLSEEEFNACIADEAQIGAMNDRIEEGQRRYGVNSTPSFVINGEVFIGEQPATVFAEAVAEATGAPVPAEEETTETEGQAQ